MSTIEINSPLYLHPFEGSNTVQIEKLQGSGNYRAWSRSFEIGLGSKRKHGFLTGAVKRDPDNNVKQDAWDTCNNMVISWIISNVSDSIEKSIMFMNEASQIWKHLEQRFSVINGSRKYKICKDIFETKQGGKSINDLFHCYENLVERA